MLKVTVTCTHCHKTIDGIETYPATKPDGTTIPGATAGFYKVTDERWKSGLTLIVCDECAGV